MINDKKIDYEANHIAEAYVLNNNHQDGKIYNICANLFKEGAKWAINEFLKDLWHDASEKPLLRNGKCLVVYNGGTIDIFKISFVYEMLSNYGKDDMGWKYWCYVSDLLPKKGGENEKE